MSDMGDEKKKDSLSDALRSLRFRSSVFCRSELWAPWGFAVSARELATFHFVVDGACFLEIDGIDGAQPIRAGDLVIVPSGSAHVVRDSRKSSVLSLEELIESAPPDESGCLKSGGIGAATVLLCGGFFFEGHRAHPLLNALPPVMLLHTRDEPRLTWLREVLLAIADEYGSGGPGSELFVDRLLDLVFVEAVRTHIGNGKKHSATTSGWLEALRDPQIALAVSIIHDEMEQSWTVGRLAARAGMSRTVFAVRFALIVGESPLRYLTRCRMARAVSMLRGSSHSLADIAESAGYTSEVAFRKAFKRHVGVSPGQFRRSPSIPESPRVAALRP